MSALPRRRTKLALAATFLFGASTSTSFAAIQYLSNCNDSGAGSLRAAVAAAQSGDTVELAMPVIGGTAPLSCSQITLTTGAIAVSQHSLTVEAPYPITVSGQTYSDRVFYHSGTGKLELEGFTVSKGYSKATVPPHSFAPAALGGCIFSKGDVTLSNMHVSRCQLRTDYTTQYNVVEGAGVASYGETQLLNSVITQSSITSKTSPGGYIGGAGLYAAGGAAIINSTLSGNGTYYSPGVVGTGTGCAAIVIGDMYVSGSTISQNKCAGAALFNILNRATAAPNSSIVVESTISDNVGAYGANLIASSITVANSTVANNQKGGLSLDFIDGVSSFPSSYPVSMFSNIVATTAPAIGVASGQNVLGANNFVTSIKAPAFPADTKSSGCLWLGLLQNNGGPTQTRALMSHSVAIDSGNSSYPGQTNDQRGLPRSSGPAPDIGAFEVQQNDVIFNTEFESCI